MSELPTIRQPWTSRVVEVFLRGNLSAMLVVIALIAGVVALVVTPREEEPQIVVPLADVLISVPGASAEEVERQVATRLEKLLYQIDGVEYVYSMSRANEAVVTVRFYVGQDREDSLVKLYNKISMNLDAVPPQVAGWVVKPIEIDDVPIVAITLWSERYDDFALRRMAEELELRLQDVPGTGRTEVIGGRRRQVRVLFDPQQMAARGISVEQLGRALQAANVTLPAGGFDQADQRRVIEAGAAFSGAEELDNLVVGVHGGGPVYLHEVARVVDGPAELDSYCRFGFGRAAAGAEISKGAAGGWTDAPAVTVTVAKKKGGDARRISRAVQQRLAELKVSLLPDGVYAHITRDYGKTANDKVNELVEALGVAIVIVIALIAVTLGWREGLIVATAVPITFALTLLINWLAGYTINRVTLFALILALGLVVDDPIVDVENIFRHLRMKKQRPLMAVLAAVNEVRPPIILATLAVIISFIPMAFITGMMGPYMRPMALNVPLAMLMSLVVAFTITPWMSYHVLKGRYAKEERPYVLQESLIYRGYERAIGPMLDHRWARLSLLGAMAGLFAFSVWVAMDRRVPLKMLPFDNKNELQVVVDMPEGTTLEQTEAATAALAGYLRGVPEVTDVTSYVGMGSPMDFNGMVRHYYLRRGSNVADIRVNLVEKHHRTHQSHEIALRMRQELSAIAERYGANIKMVEAPPGPPVISTVVAEIYGQPYHSYAELMEWALVLRDRLEVEPGVVDVDDTIEAEQVKYRFVVDKEKAALVGLSTRQVAEAVQAAVAGRAVSVLRLPEEVNPLEIVVQLPLERRSDIASLEQLYVGGSGGRLVQLAELGRFEKLREDQTIYHKNLRRVVYVFAEMAGRAPAEAILDVQADQRVGKKWQEVHPGPPVRLARPLTDRSYFSNGGGVPWGVPAGIEVVFSGEGEWKITLDVFRDLGIAFAAACLGIYVLLVYETGSYLMPLILMISIPLTIIGIMPGFWLLNAVGADPVGGGSTLFVDLWPNPTFFTATAMIGMIALSGIAVRNAILLIEFVRKATADGKPLRQAIIESGAVRFRPIFLTAGTAMLAAGPITMDPVFSGLAWALIFGLFVSTAFTLLVIPTVYYMVYGRRTAA